MTSNRARAYSYLRFSTPEQMRGDSFRRQTEAARAYAERNGLDLDAELTFRDLGVSAYRGANAVDGALAKFTEAVDAGKVAPGSYLLVENLDRLSRDKIMPALNRFAAILEKGIRVVTLTDGKCYDAASLNYLPDLMMSLLVMSRAHEESQVKSLRARAAWQNKRTEAGNGKIMTTRCPAWLKFEHSKFAPIPERAKVVRRIFRMAVEGHGKAHIARALNKDGVPAFGRSDGWYPVYIGSILMNEAAIGRFQPRRVEYVGGKRKIVSDGQSIDGYYPAVVKPEDFYRVRRGASGVAGRPLRNVLSGLAVCVRCGEKMHYQAKRDTPYLVCDGRRRKATCEAPSVQYNPVLAALVACLDADDLDLRALLGYADDRRQEIRYRLDAIAGQVAAAEQGIANLLDVLERGPSDAIERRLSKQERALYELGREKDTLEVSLRAVGDNTYETMQELIRGVSESGPDFNVRLNAALKRLINKVAVGVDDSALKWIESGIAWAGRKKLPPEYGEIAAEAAVSIGVEFSPQREMAIYAHPRKAGRFIAGAAQEGMKLFRLKISGIT